MLPLCTRTARTKQTLLLTKQREADLSCAESSPSRPQTAATPPATRPAPHAGYLRQEEGGKDATLAAPAQVDSHGEVPVAAVRVEAVVPQGELHQRDVRGVHALQGDAGRADVPAGFRDQVLQRLQHLLQDGALDQASLEHGCCGDGSGWSGRDAVMRVTPSGWRRTDESSCCWRAADTTLSARRRV